MTITTLATKIVVIFQNCDKDMALRKIALNYRFHSLVAALLLVGAASAFADDNFAIAPSAHDNLVIFGPKGDRVAELSVPTISQQVTVGNTSFQISYGRDANNYLTAIIAPSSSQPQDLHFTVLNKSVESSKQAVVTLTFQDAKHVSIDPGYIGTVSVDSHALRHHSLADSNPAPARSYQPAPAPAPRTVADAQPQDIPSPVTHQAPAAPQPLHEAPAPLASNGYTPPSRPATSSSPAYQPPTTARTVASLPTSAPMPVASNNPPDETQPAPLSPPPLLGSLLSQPPIVPPKGVANSTPPPSQKLNWAEPVTPPNGKAIPIGIDEMKLVAVHGPVTVTTPSGATRTGTEGMVVPSGSTVKTADNGSAAVFIGGVDSARLLPNTDAKVTESLSDNNRKTRIDIGSGTVFNRVGHRPGEKQDYTVQTPEGVAAARGTDFAVTVTESGGHTVTIVATAEGVVTLTDSNGRVITISPPNANGQLAVGSVPTLPSSVVATIVAAFLADVQQFNTNINALKNATNLTPAQQAYLDANNLGFDANTQMFDSNTGNFTAIYENSAAPLLLDNNNTINTVLPTVRTGVNQQLEPFGTVPLTPF